jgi:hypothetical protein
VPKRSSQRSAAITSVTQLTQDLQDLLGEVKKRYLEGAPLAERFVYPLFGKNDNRTSSVVGSCFVLAVGAERLLISASHVFRGRSKPLIFMGGSPATGNEHVVVVQGTLCTTSMGPLDNEPHDVAVVRLRAESISEMGNLPVVSLEQIDLEPSESDILFEAKDPLTMFCLLGFPSSLTKERGRGRNSGATISVGYWSFAADLSEYTKAHIDPRTHLLIPMPREDVISTNDRFVLAPKPQGMSGGPVWRFRFFSHTGVIEAKLAGILTEHRRDIECAVASRVWVALNLARRAFPHLSQLLPVATSFREPDLFSSKPTPSPY